MKLRYIAWNGAVAALFVALSYLLPIRLGSSLYMLAAFDPGLVPGLAVGNALAGVHHRPLDLIEGAVIGAFTPWLCSKVGPLWSPVVVAVVPSVWVAFWLTQVVGLSTAVVPGIVMGQLIAAAVGGIAILPLGRRLWKQGFLRGAER
ncbi:MAG: hypothetical protein JWN15_3101 [Firmicutes bacterium]|nr:hypothetical protein [Bacillota bacterium]